MSKKHLLHNHHGEARPDHKMSRRSGVKSSSRQVLKRWANAKRRRRDREVEL